MCQLNVLWALKTQSSWAAQDFVKAPNMHDIMKQKVISLITRPDPLGRT